MARENDLSKPSNCLNHYADRSRIVPSRLLIQARNDAGKGPKQTGNLHRERGSH